MTADASRHHDRLAALFAELVAEPQDLRRDRLESLAGEDPGLARELAELIRCDAGEGVLDRELDETWLDKTWLDALPSRADAPPARVGPFEILGLLGRGGMGAVYRARQEHPERIVALKLVRASLLAPDAARRLRFEADVLARLTHPGIAPIHDAGTVSDSGTEVSYFAMELVEGAPITDHARGLPIAERVRLIAAVCDAVHHAHQRGVLHRDLKPANILVGADTRPRVLDFGIARLIDPGVQVTSAGYDTGALVGTLAYMSPEQLDGRSGLIDTRTDVHALGAILYELLTGQPPVPIKGLPLTEAVQALQTRPVARPRQLDARISRDLETVTLKAIEPDIERRYGSASDLAAELRRVLAHEPVQGRPATARYRAGRFIRRNPGLCAGIGASCMLLVVALGAVGYGYSESARRADTLERANAEIAEEAQKAVAVNDFLRRMLVSADPLGETGSGRAGMTVVEMLDRESGQIDEAFDGLPASEASVRSTIGNVYLSLGMHAKAEPHLRRAVELHDAVWGAESADADRARRDLAAFLAETDRTDEAIAIYRAILNGQEARGTTETVEHAITATRLGAILLARREYAEAERLLRRAVPILERDGTPRADALPVAINNLARARSGQADAAEAEALYARARDAFAAMHGPHHSSVAIAENNIAALRAGRGDHAGAAESYRSVLEILEPAMGPEHPTVAAVRHNLAFALYDMREFEPALDELETVLGVYRAVYGDDHPETLTTRMAIADTLLELDRAASAAEVFEDTARRRLARNADDPLAQRARFCRGLCLLRLDRADEGDAMMSEACEAYVALAGAGSPTAQRMLRELAGRRLDQGRADEARALAGRLDPDIESNRAVLDRFGLDHAP